LANKVENGNKYTTVHSNDFYIQIIRRKYIYTNFIFLVLSLVINNAMLHIR